jgi:hypothetical protein
MRNFIRNLLNTQPGSDEETRPQEDDPQSSSYLNQRILNSELFLDAKATEVYKKLQEVIEKEMAERNMPRSEAEKLLTPEIARLKIFLDRLRDEDFVPITDEISDATIETVLKNRPINPKAVEDIGRHRSIRLALQEELRKRKVGQSTSLSKNTSLETELASLEPHNTRELDMVIDKISVALSSEKEESLRKKYIDLLGKATDLRYRASSYGEKGDEDILETSS